MAEETKATEPNQASKKKRKNNKKKNKSSAAGQKVIDDQGYGGMHAGQMPEGQGMFDGDIL